MLEFVAMGPVAGQRWRRRIQPGEVVRIGRTTTGGWDVPWDMRISREHADLQLDGERLRVRCLGTARNPALVRGQLSKDFHIAVGEDFQIGETIFRLDRVDEERLDAAPPRAAAPVAASPVTVSPSRPPESEIEGLRNQLNALRAQMESVAAARLKKESDARAQAEELARRLAVVVENQKRERESAERELETLRAKHSESLSRVEELTKRADEATERLRVERNRREMAEDKVARRTEELNQLKANLENLQQSSRLDPNDTLFLQLQDEANRRLADEQTRRQEVEAKATELSGKLDAALEAAGNETNRRESAEQHAQALADQLRRSEQESTTYATQLAAVQKELEASRLAEEESGRQLQRETTRRSELESQIQAFAEQSNLLDEQWQTSEKSRRELQEAFARSEAARQAAEQRYESLVADQQESQERFDESVEQLATLNQQRETAEADRRRLTEQLAQATQSLQQQTAESQTLRDQCDTLRRQVDTLWADADELRVQIAGLEQSQQQAAQRAETESRLRSESQAALAAVTADRDQLAEALRQMSAERDRHAAEVAMLQAAVESLRSSATVGEQSQQQIAAERAAAESRQREYEQLLQVAREEARSKSVRLAEVLEELTALSCQVRDLSTSQQTEATERQNLATQLETALTDRKRFENALRRRLQEQQRMESETKTLAARVQEETAARTKAEEELQRLVVEVDRLNDDLTKLADAQASKSQIMRREAAKERHGLKSGEFDPYHRWLGIPPDEQPADHYRLLGLSRFEEDANVIEDAADRQMAHIRRYQSGKNSQLSQQLLNELSAARVCLLSPEKKHAYDQHLWSELAAQDVDKAADATSTENLDSIDGRFLGEYNLLDFVHSGPTGSVFKAEHHTMGRVVAIKVLSPDATSSPELVSKFRRRIAVLAGLNHPHLVTAFDAGERDGSHYLTMEFVDGQDLIALMKLRSTLPIAEVVEYTIQAALGLDYLHQRGIVHRDVKPSHLLIEPSGRVKLIGLGYALFTHEAELADAAALDEIGQLIGTLDFMSPEQIENPRHVDGRTDIYSLGCTLFTVLSRRLVYPVKTTEEKIQAHRLAGLPSLRQLRPDVPEALEAVYARMIAKRPEFRFNTMGEVVAALRACQELLLHTPPASLVAAAAPQEMVADPNASFLERLAEEKPRWKHATRH